MHDRNCRPGKMRSDKIISFGPRSVPGQFPRWIMMNYLNFFLIHGLLQAILYNFFPPLLSLTFGISLIVTRGWYCSFRSLALGNKSRLFVKLIVSYRGITVCLESHLLYCSYFFAFYIGSFVVIALNTLSGWSLPQLVNILFIIIFMIYY